MSAKEAKPAEGEEVAAPPKSKKLLIIIVAAVFLLAVVGGGAVFFLKSKKQHADENGDEEAVAETAKEKKKEKKKDGHPPVFVNLEPFTVNLVQETGDQYLQLAISLELEEAAAEGAIKSNTPKIRNAITMLLSSKKASELAPREGKEKLAAELKDAVNEVLDPPETPKKGKKKPAEVEGPVKAVLYTAFIIQ